LATRVLLLPFDGSGVPDGEDAVPPKDKKEDGENAVPPDTAFDSLSFDDAARRRSRSATRL